MIWHDHANKILNMESREDQVKYFTGLDQSLQGPVGSLVRMQNEAKKNKCVFGWRDSHEIGETK